MFEAQQGAPGGAKKRRVTGAFYFIFEDTSWPTSSELHFVTFMR